MKIDWKRKLTSRKFWIAVVGFVVPLLLSFGIAESVATQISGVIMSGATCIAYILGEGLVDAEFSSNNNKTDSENDKVE
ncbi:MAG: hypothetical protein IJD37_07735 [Clostridia bacterium]|nr:hypothetical protein [Clostridia bacterium]